MGGTGVGAEVTTVVEDATPVSGYRSLALSHAEAVTAGTVTVALRVKDSGSLGSTLTIRDRSITTLFVPFGNAGSQGVLKPSVADGSEAPTLPTEEDG